MESVKHFESVRRTWLWIGAMVTIILFKGFFAFWVVSDLGQPSWSYRPVNDLPGASPYGIYKPLPHPQHIRGAQGE
jgi:hypothetical protein